MSRVLTIDYSLVFESPLLVTSQGAIPGICDRITTTDNNGLPYVPASSIRGRVKDSIRRFLVDNNSGYSEFRVCFGQSVPINSKDTLKYCSPKSPCALCRIFGSPGALRRGFEFSGAHYPESAVLKIRQAFQVGDLTEISLSRRTRNRRDDALRRVSEDHLFVDGVAELFSELNGTIRETPTHMRFDDDVRKFDYRLLLLGLRLTTELGASRNRGYGQCEFLLSHAGWEKEVEALIEGWNMACNNIGGGS